MGYKDIIRFSSVYEADYVTVPEVREEEGEYMTPERLDEFIEELKGRMKEAAKKLQFEEAALLRDRIKDIEKKGFDILSFA